jgi:large subunit ribosomal protein L10
MNKATIAKKQEAVQLVLNKINASVAEVTELRVKLHAENCEMKVAKNNILRHAAEQAGFTGVEDHLSGPCAVVLGHDEVAAAKITYDFMKDHEKLTIKGGVVNGVTMTEQQLQALSKLPNKEGMISMLLSVLQGPMRGLACAIKAVSEKEN